MPTHCPFCGRFANASYVKTNGWCEKCDDLTVEKLMEEEAELDPHGPCGDMTRLQS
jgi:hypothetical protein